jgi:branched-chain amino acid transport system permease protein
MSATTPAPPTRRSRTLVVVMLALVLVTLALLPAATARADVLNLGFLIFLNVALAQSWNALGGMAGQINLGHAAFFGLGASVMRWLWIAGVHPYLGLAAGGAVALLFGLLIGVPAFRLRGAYFAIGTLALAEILRLTTGNVFAEVSTLPAPIIAGYRLAHRYYLALALAVATMGILWWMSRSRFGLGLRGLRDDEDAAEASGVNTLSHKLAALAISTALAGLAGAVFAFYHVSYYPQMPFSPAWTFDALLITFIGGVGTLWGPVVGAVFYVLVKDFLARSLVEIHLLIFGALFVAVVMLWPGGLVEAAGWMRRVRAPGQRPGLSAHPH